MESLFVYKLNVLEYPKEEQIRKIEGIMRKFIWQGKKPKIALDTLQLPKKYGGLWLFSIRDKKWSLNIQWVKRIQEQKFYKECFVNNFPIANFTQFWECNINVKDVNKLERKGSSYFWKEILTDWCKFNFHDAQNGERVREQVLWYNSLIVNNKEWLYYPRAHKRGMVYIKDICNENGDIMNHNEIKQKFPGVVNWLEYASLVKAIPDHWKFFLSSEVLIDTWVPHCELLKSKKVANTVYRVLGEAVDTKIMKYRNRWMEILPLESVPDPKEFLKCFQYLYVITNVTKLRDFQYRLLLNKIFVNDILYQWKVVETPMCTFCNSQIETVSHLFWDCEKIKPIWRFLQEWLKEYDLKLQLNVKTIIFNKTKEGSLVTDFIVLLTKQYIYQCRCKKISCNTTQLSSLISTTHQMELYNVKVKRNLKKHVTKWKGIFPALEENYVINY